MSVADLSGGPNCENRFAPAKDLAAIGINNAGEAAAFALATLSFCPSSSAQRNELKHASNDLALPHAPRVVLSHFSELIYQLNKGPMRLYACLARMSPNGEPLDISQRDLARASKLSRSNVQIALAQLEERGLLKTLPGEWSGVSEAGDLVTFAESHTGFKIRPGDPLRARFNSLPKRFGLSQRDGRS